MSPTIPTTETIPGEPDPEGPADMPNAGDPAPLIPEPPSPADPIHDPRIPLTNEPPRGV